MEREFRVFRESNNITIYKMDHPSCVSAFHRAMREGLRREYTNFTIIWKGEKVFPDACVPIAGLIAYYKENCGISFNHIIPKGNYLTHCGFESPFVRTENEIASEVSPFDKIFRYSNSAQVAAITQAYIDYISQQTECSDGVLSGLIWCINEVIDNVLLHSEAGYGLVMAQFHPISNRIAICVYDSGIGIYNSLKKSKHKPKSLSDAISLAVQEGVGDGKGQGNGLFGLYQIIKENQGRLTITSGSSSIMWTSNCEMKKFEELPYIGKNFGATTVDFMLNLGNNIDIQSAFKTIGGFDGFDIRVDNMLLDDDSLKYDVYANSKGTATRESGMFLRNDVINLLTRQNTIVILDFIGVKTVSSSFIDEFIAKMIVRLGITKFNQVVRIINMNEDVRFLCDRSIYMRIHDDWANKK